MSSPQARSKPLLDVRQLEVVYNDVATAVQGVSLEVAENQIVAVIGTNGAGKTTTLRAVSGFLPAEDVAITDGTITFERKSLAGCLPHDISRRGVVLVPEREKLFHTLTVQENLHFSLTRRRCDDPRQGARLFSAACRAQNQDRRPAQRRRKADAGDRHGAGLRAEASAGR